MQRNGRSDLTAVLLCGGKSRRMGRDKALVEINGVTLWRRQIALLEQLEPAEIFIAGEPRESTTHPVIADAAPDAGPLGGLVAALRECTTPLLLALAIDVPNVTAAFLRQLIDPGGNRGVVPKYRGRYEPLVAVYPRNALPLAERLLVERNYSLQHFAAACFAADLLDERRITAADEALFANLNSPEDVKLHRRHSERSEEPHELTTGRSREVLRSAHDDHVVEHAT